CQTRTCTGGMCGVSNAAQGTPLASQTPGDCLVQQCDGMGGIQSADDNADVPVDGKQCTSDLCAAGVPSNPAVPAGRPCSEGGGTMCNDSGTCVECLGAADCPGVDSECQQRTCTAGACGLSFAPSGTPVSTQTSGDCKKNVCDGTGNTISMDDP